MHRQSLHKSKQDHWETPVKARKGASQPPSSHAKAVHLVMAVYVAQATTHYAYPIAGPDKQLGPKKSENVRSQSRREGSTEIMNTRVEIPAIETPMTELIR